MEANRIAKSYDDQLTLVESDVLSLAEAMPAERYGFVPPGGGFSGARTFGDQIKHLATLIQITAARVLEEPSPHRPGRHNNGPDSVRTKEEIIAYLRDSIAYARRAMASLNETNHLDPVPSSFGDMPRFAVAAGLAYHSYNHYGQMVVYARLNGIVPPGSVATGEEAVRRGGPEE